MRYLTKTPGQGLLYKANNHLRIEVKDFPMQTGPGPLVIEDPPPGMSSLLMVISSHGEVRSRPWLPVRVRGLGVPPITGRLGSSIEGGGKRNSRCLQLKGSSSSLIYLRFDIRSNKLPVCAQVIGYKTARSTWEALDRAYTSQTNARYYQIKHYLFNIRKGSYSITEYMDRIRRLTDELSLIQQPMSDR
jgi:hypothetical protein